MKRVVVLVLSLLFAAAAAAPPARAEIKDEAEWKKLLDEIKDEIYGLSKKKRFEILERLGNANYIKAVQCLVSFIERPNPRLAPLEQKERDTIKEIQRITKLAINQGNRLSQDDINKLKNLQSELKEINDAILRESDLKDSAIAAVAKTTNPQSIEWLKSAWRKSQVQSVQMGIIRAFGLMGCPDVLNEIKEAASDKDPQLRTTAIESLGRKNKDDAFDAVLKALSDDFWQVRCTAVKILGAFGDLKAVDPLIEALGREPGRIRGDIDDVLLKLTGKSLDGDFEMWKSWWAAHKTEVMEGKKFEQEGSGLAGGVKTVSFYGIRTHSKNILFIIDVSGSMDWKSMAENKGGSPAPPPETSGGKEAGKGEEVPVGPGPADDRKISVAKWELKKAIANLDEDAHFNIIYYNSEVKMYSPKMLAATKPIKTRTLQFIDQIKAEGGTNIYDSLIKAFTLGGGENDKKNFEQSVDTVFFLSDGVPTAGRITDIDLILKDVQHRNKLRKIIIHAVGITTETDKPEEKSKLEEFVKKLADENGGKYVQK